MVVKPMDLPELKNGQPTVLTHFYRGELGRMMIWRERLDRTTNWAIIAVVAIVSYEWTNEDFMHIALLLGNAVLYLLLMIEARRYMFYDAYRARVRMLETHWILPHLGQVEMPNDTEWRSVLSNDLAVPSMKITIWEALSRRLSRNYIWLFLILFAGWSLKVMISDVSLKPSVNGVMIGVAVTAFYAYLAFLLAYGRRGRQASGEFKPRSKNTPDDWRI